MPRPRIARPGGDHGCRKSQRPAAFHFFKIILSTTSEQHMLLLPSKFVAKCGDELGHFADLMVPNGSVWKVGILKAKSKIWFNEGWKSFADHHSIGYGHFLVFAYTGLCSFKVLIFDMTASEVEYPCYNQSPNREENYPRRNEVEVEDDKPSAGLNSVISPPSSRSFNSKVPEASAKKRDSSEIHTKPEQKPQVKRSRGSASMVSPDFGQVYTKTKRPKVEPLDEIIHVNDKDTMSTNPGKYEHLEENRAECESSRTKSMGKCKDQEAEIVSCKMYQCSKAIPNNERAIAAAKRYIPKRPSFMVILRGYLWDTARVYVPSRFAPYLNDVPKCIKLRVSNGREWEVQLFREGCKRTNIGGQWKLFMRENNLEVGDVCVFELMENKEVLEVSIFRATEDVKLEH